MLTQMTLVREDMSSAKQQEMLVHVLPVEWWGLQKSNMCSMYNSVLPFVF
jgi:hypothetical protein